MKIAVLADAHGNHVGFSAALADARSHCVDLIVSAGDMLASFPGGPEILQTLVAENIPIVLGNADERLLKWWHAESTSHLRISPQFRPLQTSAARFTDSDLTIIEQWPLTHLFTAEGKNVMVCHGTQEPELARVLSETACLVEVGVLPLQPSPLVSITWLQ